MFPPLAFLSPSKWTRTLKQSQKTQGFCVAEFATLSDERRSRSKIFLLFIWIKEPCIRKFEGPHVRNFLGFRKLKAAKATTLKLSDFANT